LPVFRASSSGGPNENSTHFTSMPRGLSASSTVWRCFTAGNIPALWNPIRTSFNCCAAAGDAAIEIDPSKATATPAAKLRLVCDILSLLRLMLAIQDREAQTLRRFFRIVVSKMK
jgi:hypothetical protein